MTLACLTSKNSGNLGVMWKTVSEDCNLACEYCYYSTCGGKVKSPIRKIDSQLLEKFIHEYMAKTQGSASFAWQGGEPLLAGLEFFEKVVNLQAKYSPPKTIISNALQTNATLIDDNWARFFKRYNFLIGVSLDGPKEIHDSKRITGSGKGSYDRVMNGIHILKKNDVDFNILTVIHKGNVGKAKELMEFYKKEGFGFIQFIPCMDFRAQETHKQGHYLITPEEYGDFLCDVFDLWYNEGEPDVSIRFFDNMLSVYVNQEAELCIHRAACPKTLVLEQNGDAYPCDFYLSEDYKLGNVGVDSLDAILNSPVYQQFLGLKPKVPKKCTQCEYFTLCHGGCPRNRKWMESGHVADVDYFCESYLKVYQYADERMNALAGKLKNRWLEEYIKSGLKVPGRNELCICGSNKKFKKCCGAHIVS
ncbi:anaerobic sulfatase maturase [Neobacillus sp. Marseille-QA0830]